MTMLQTKSLRQLADGSRANLLAEAYAPIAPHLLRAMTLFDREISCDLPFIHELCDTVRAYRGKMLRPALLLLVADACGKITDTHVTLAAVVEMVHMATLVHDDVLDDAQMRRRQPTIASLSGNTAAVLLGDYLISHAFHLCSGLTDSFASRRIGSATNTVCEGEMLQNHHRADWTLPESAYIDIVARKTGALTAVACELGAKVAGAEERVVTSMSEFGMSAGIAFQIVDDVLDFTGDPEAMGKTLGRDAELGKLTLPLIHGLSRRTDGDRDQLIRKLKNTEAENTAWIQVWLSETSSLEYATTRAGQYVESAAQKLSCLREGPARNSLQSLIGFIVSRKV